MSVLDDFGRMRLYRKRATESEQLADTAPTPDVQRRYRTIGRHFRDLAEREEQSDQARLAERLQLLRLKRQHGTTQQTPIQDPATQALPAEEAAAPTGVASVKSKIQAFLIRRSAAA